MKNIISPSPLTLEQGMPFLDKRRQETLAKIEAYKKLHQEEMKIKDEEHRAYIKKEMKNLIEEMKNLSSRFDDLGWFSDVGNKQPYV